MRVKSGCLATSVTASTARSRKSVEYGFGIDLVGAPSTLVLNQYCYDNVEREFAGWHCQRKPLVDRVIKMHKLLGLKEKVYVDDMRGWCG